MTESPTGGPVLASDRITSLDTIRGVAVLGILTMNVVSYGLETAAYYNIDATSPQTWLDWLIGGAGEILFDQKFMGLFSMLFGAGIVLFADRADSKGRRGGRLSLWRNFLLLLIGLAHSLIWEGDILTVYALCAPVLLAVRKLPGRLLLAAGVAMVLVSPLGAVLAQATVDSTGAGLGEYWGVEGEISDAVGLWLIVDYAARALGMMLIGVAAFRNGFLTGSKDDRFYRRSAVWGLAVGLPLSAFGFAAVAGSGFSTDLAAVGSIPNTLATIPIVIGYIGLITLWHHRTEERPLNRRLRAVGRMALTNYLSQTVIGIGILYLLLDSVDLSRSALALFVLAVWALQLWWSQAWLSKRRFGPVEWAWRTATYGRLPRAGS